MANFSVKPWLDRYERPQPIRSRGAFHLLSATRFRDARPVVVVVPSPFACGVPAAEAFREIERVHAFLDHPIIPRVAARGDAGGTPYLELDCDATMDGVELQEILADSLSRLPFALADGFISLLGQAMTSANEVVDPVHGRRVCLGRLSMANVLFSRSGRFFLVGYGHNFPLEPGEQRAEAWTEVLASPEVLRGEAPSPEGDRAALLLLSGALLPHVDLEPIVTRLLDAPRDPADAALLERLWREAFQILGAPARLRWSAAKVEELIDELRALCGASPDPGGFVAFVGGLLDR